MAAEAKRGCGFRRVGGTYLVADGPGFPCGRFPVHLIPCPLCDHRPAFTRSLQRITPRNILHASPVCGSGDETRCAVCPLNKAMQAETAGLMWVGERFYTPGAFIEEAQRLGISKRISNVPKWLEVGKTWVFLAHEKAVTEPCQPCRSRGTIVTDTPAEGDWVPQGHECETCDGEGMLYTPAVFYAFKPSRIERIVTDQTPPEELEALRAQGITPVIVPHDDPDHQPRRGKKGDDDEA